MLSSISIQGFKAITDKLELNNLAPINYLIGPNGSGKSSVLEGVWQIFNDMHGGHNNDDKKRALNVENQYSDTETQFNKKSEFKFVYQNQKEYHDITLSNFHYETRYGNETVLVWDYVGNEYLRNRIYTATSLLVSDQNFRKSLLGNYYQEIQSQLKGQSCADFNKTAFRSTVMQPGKNTKLLSLKELFYDNYGEKGFNQEKFNWLERNYKEKIQNILPFLSNEEKLILSSNFNTKTPKISENLSLGDLSDGTLRLMSLFYLEEFIIEGKFINERSENLFILIEEPENNLHPELQKQVPVILNQLHKNLSEKATKAHNSSLNPNKCLKYPIQFLISTHSPFIINSALELDRENFERFEELRKKTDRDETEENELKNLSNEKGNFKPTHKVYHLDKVDGVTKLVGEIPTTPSANASTTQEGNFVSTYDSILGSIGVQPSDLLFANGVIWVEGPSDAIYIEHWLKLYQEKLKEDNAELKVLKKGSAYSFQMLNLICLNHTGTNEKFWNDPESIQEAINLLEINRKFVVVIDNDGDFENCLPNANSESPSQRERKIKFLDKIKEQKKIISEGYEGIRNNEMDFWIGKEAMTVENYLDKLVSKKQSTKIENPKSMKARESKLKTIFSTTDKGKVEGQFSKAKAHYARQICKKFTSLDDFCSKDDELYINIQSLYATIQSWNEPK